MESDFFRAWGPALTHLFFADDIVMFAEASLAQVRIIQRIMDQFCVDSRHKVSIPKTQICFSPNVLVESRWAISKEFGFVEVSDLGRYLGVPLLHSRVTRATYAAILDSMRTRLSGWAARSLSLAGRITLAKSVLLAIPVHLMQSAWLPKGLCDDMERLIRRFVWGVLLSVRESR